MHSTNSIDTLMATEKKTAKASPRTAASKNTVPPAEDRELQAVASSTPEQAEPVEIEESNRDIQKLQRAIVDGLEDVKAQHIQVFNTAHLSPLFERVIIASGTSNRQTKALAGSVRDAVRDAGFPKPRMEGEENGEWIIVDCGSAVAHIMQPAIRQYYALEEIWGDKPVRMRLGKPARPARAAAAEGDKPARTRKPSTRRAPAAAKAEQGAAPASAATDGQPARKPRSRKPAAGTDLAAAAPAPKAAPRRSRKSAA